MRKISRLWRPQTQPRRAAQRYYPMKRELPALSSITASLHAAFAHLLLGYAGFPSCRILHTTSRL